MRVVSWLVVLVCAVAIVGCAEDPIAPGDPYTSTLQPIDLKYRLGDTMIVKVNDLFTGDDRMDTFVVSGRISDVRYTTTNWRNINSIVQTSYWVDSGYLRMGIDPAVNTYGKLPTLRGEVIADSVVLPPKTWDRELLKTVTADTTLALAAGTFRCASFARYHYKEGILVYQHQVWYAPGYGVVLEEKTDIKPGEVLPQRRFRSVLFKKVIK